MPEVQQALDGERWREIRHESILIANLWLKVAIAAERGDRFEAHQACAVIAKLTKATFALVKTLGSTEVADG